MVHMTACAYALTTVFASILRLRRCLYMHCYYVTLPYITFCHATLCDMNNIASITSMAEPRQSYMNASIHTYMHALMTEIHRILSHYVTLKMW